MSTPATIGDLIERDLNHHIEEIIKLDQLDERAVNEEITEYVVTKSLRQHYRDLFKAIADFPSEPHEGVGVWVSGFFGSGKSSFAKNLGYVLANRPVLGHPAAELFKSRLNDRQCADYIDFINQRIPTEIVMFDVQTDRASGGAGGVSISYYMYRSLLRTLDYAEDFDIAELEQTLEQDGRLEKFIKLFEVRYQTDWRRGRKTAEKMNRASAILHELDEKTYPQADSWAKAQGQKRIEVSPGFLVEKTFDLIRRRRPDKAISFVIDEVGAYVAYSADRMADLRSVVEEFGKESRNRVKARSAHGPVWVIVTSQEKLEEVVSAIGSKRGELARLQDRFRYRVDLSPADIREVATKRVLVKKEQGAKLLKELYKGHEGQLNGELRLERTSRRTEISEHEFVEFYPYPPHFIDLSIDIMTGIRLEPGGPRQLGGANRTIIKQAFEMLTSDRTKLAHAAVGRLVTLDLVFELVEGNLSTEKRKDISDIANNFGQNSWESRTAKALALLGLVRDLPRTEANVAAVLVDSIDTPAPLPQVKSALELLQEAKYVRHTEEGFKLQTSSEKNWETERRAIDPKPRDRNEILRESLNELFGEPALRTYSFKGLRNFRVGLTVNDVELEDGQLPLHILTADAPGERDALEDHVRTQSRDKNSHNEIFWVFALTSEIDARVAELFRSRQMVNKYDQLRGQGKLTTEETTCLANERQEVPRIAGQLRAKIEEALKTGNGFFRGVSKDGAALGKTPAEVFKGLFDAFAPELYGKLEMGAKPLKEHAAEEVLKAANLSGLPPVFYEGEQGYQLIKREGSKYVPNREAPVATEVLAFLRDRASYGEKVSGRDLEQKFLGLGYGWERELLQTVLAVLLRAGAIEVTYQGRRFRNHQDPIVRAPFSTINAFRNASYAPRETISLKTLTTAAERYEELTGQEVDVEESAIAQAFKKIVEQEHTELLPLVAKVQAYRLPVEAELGEYGATIEQIMGSATDDCVRILAEEGRSLKEAIDRTHRLRDALSDGNLSALNRARQAMDQMWPAIEQRPEGQQITESVGELQSLVSSQNFYEKLGEIGKVANDVEGVYAALYKRLHEDRASVVEKEIEAVKGLPGWVQIPEELKSPLIAQLDSRACSNLERPKGAPVCRTCRATIAQIESDIAAAPGLRAEIAGKVQEMTASKPVKRIRMANLFDQPLDSRESVQNFLDVLSQQLLKLIDEGVLVVIE